VALDFGKTKSKLASADVRLIRAAEVGTTTTLENRSAKKSERSMRAYIILISLAVLFGGIMSAQSIPAAIFTDPSADPAHPAGLTALRIPTHGVLINGVIYQSSGVGPHPTLIICHGLPGNEKNLDLAQAARRAGWNALTFNYRGSWGSPGDFRLSQNLEDAEGVLAYLREQENAKRLGIDTDRIVMAGHSMGGWVVAQVASHDHHLAGAILISGADVGKQGGWPHGRLLALLDDCTWPLAGVTPDELADQMHALGRTFRFDNMAAGLVEVPLLAVTADDGFAEDTYSLINAIHAQGGHDIKAIHFATDHNYSDHRIALEATILNWLETITRS
jgi:uncharacterized protein